MQQSSNEMAAKRTMLTNVGNVAFSHYGFGCLLKASIAAVQKLGFNISNRTPLGLPQPAI